ncbi:hypothetical protein ACFL59_02405 [Planctomycetota bacterium]
MKQDTHPYFRQTAFALQEYGKQVSAGSLSVVGAIYDFCGDLEKGRGRLVVVNVNGESDPEKVAAHPLLKEVGETSATAPK